MSCWQAQNAGALHCNRVAKRPIQRGPRKVARSLRYEHECFRTIARRLDRRSSLGRWPSTVLRSAPFRAILLGQPVRDICRTAFSSSRLHYSDSDACLGPLMVRGSHPRRSVCDDVAGEALDATRLWRVLHCVPVPGATQASLGMPQASSPPPIAHTGGGEASAGTRKGLLTWLPSDP